MAAGGKGLDMHIAVHGIPTEQAAKEEDLLNDKRPHPERGGLVLLFGCLKVMSTSDGVCSVRQRRPPWQVR